MPSVSHRDLGLVRLRNSALVVLPVPVALVNRQLLAEAVVLGKHRTWAKDLVHSVHRHSLALVNLASVQRPSSHRSLHQHRQHRQRRRLEARQHLVLLPRSPRHSAVHSLRSPAVQHSVSLRHLVRRADRHLSQQQANSLLPASSALLQTLHHSDRSLLLASLVLAHHREHLGQVLDSAASPRASALLPSQLQALALPPSQPQQEALALPPRPPHQLSVLLHNPLHQDSAPHRNLAPPTQDSAPLHSLSHQASAHLYNQQHQLGVSAAPPSQQPRQTLLNPSYHFLRTGMECKSFQTSRTPRSATI